MAEIFGVDRTIVTKRLKNIFTEGELEQDSVCAKFAHTGSDGENFVSEKLLYQKTANVYILSISKYRPNSSNW